MNEDSVRLAVTGLSRAGKTVFVTSLIQNLLALGRGMDTLPQVSRRLLAAGGSRLREVSILPAGVAMLPGFDHAAKFAELAGKTHSWPPRTEDVSQISLAVTIDRRSGLARQLGPRRLRIDILDYPGEWLLDLPLLRQSFANWSAGTMTLLRAPPRREAAAQFLGFVDGLRPDGQADEGTAKHGHDLYRAALETCRSRHGLRYLQPGRFLCRGPLGDAPFLWFFPITCGERPSHGTLAALLRDRFEAYKVFVQEQFFERHFVSFTRQVMLVDVLGALHAGNAAFADTARALKELAEGLQYGANRLPRLHDLAGGTLRRAADLMPAFASRATNALANKMASRQIERLVVCATKADHVPKLRRDNLRNLLRDLCAGAGSHAARTASVSYQVAAAIVSTRDASVRDGDRQVEVVEGRLAGEGRVRSFNPGDVPSAYPPDDFWSYPYFELPVFQPPAIDPSVMSGVPHLGLDAVLDDLIGDLL